MTSKNQDNSPNPASESALYADLLDAATDIIYVLDSAGRFTYANHATEVHLGWSKQDLLGKLATDIFNNSEFMERYSFLKDKTSAGDSEWDGDIHYRNRDGKEVIVASHWHSNPSENGSSARLAHIGQPVTDVRKMESHFYRLQRMQTLGPMASGVVHDLNNLLGTMMLTLDSVEDADLKMTVEEHRLLSKSTERAALLNRQLLGFAKGTSGVRKLVSPSKLMTELLDFTKSTFPSDVEFKVECPPDTSLVFIDASQIHQVLVNLAAMPVMQ